MKVKTGPASLSKKKTVLPVTSKLLKPKKEKQFKPKKVTKQEKSKSDKIAKRVISKLHLSGNEKELIRKQKLIPKKPENTNQPEVKLSTKVKIIKKNSKKRKLRSKKKRKSVAANEKPEQKNNAKLRPLEQSKLNRGKVLGAVTGLLQVSKLKKNAALLDLPQPIYMEIECVKIPGCATKQLLCKLPHSLVEELTDILLITADLKGSKIYPEKALEHYTELLEKHNINFIQKVMPLKMLRQQYLQYESRRKLVDQFDVILVEDKITNSIPKTLGNHVLYQNKMPLVVHMKRKDLKEHFQRVLSKTQLTIKPKGHMACVKVGHTKMSDKDITENILAVTVFLEKAYPGSWRNIRRLNIKTPSSPPLPIYLSLLSPNEVVLPAEESKTVTPVEGELTTMPGKKVLVFPDGTVKVKRAKEEKQFDNSVDDEILEEAKKYMESSKTVRYGESDEEKDDDSDKEADAVTEAVEQELMGKYEDSMKAKTAAGEESEEEEEEESDEEEMVVPVLGKKRKKNAVKKSEKNSPNKKQKKATQEKLKGDKPAAKGGPMNIQRRGSRGGKKSKVSKDQRKANIKRKKAGINK